MAVETKLAFSTLQQGRESVLDASVADLVIAGWTGRDAQAMEAHIRELEELGIARPKSTPTFYRVAASLLTTAQQIDVAGAASSGEAEAVLLSSGEGLWVGVGSDHTDREAETYSVTVAKQACAKPISPALWWYEDVADHWDELVLRSYAEIDGERVLYQEGSVSGLRPPGELMELYNGGLAQGTAMYCGTLAVNGSVRPAAAFTMELDDPKLGRTLTHHYTIRELPVAE